MTSVEELRCLFCKDSFENKDELQIHFRKHGDPKFNQNLKSNSKEMQSQTSSDNLTEGEAVSCDVCTEVFPTISKAITHKHKVHPDHDAKYFCPWCGKLFTMKHLYNKHIESSHIAKEDGEGKGFHCDYCEVNFFMPSAMLYHNKFFHRQDTELAAIGQSRKLKMFNQEPLPIYYCPFCGEEYFNKVNLHKHMGDDHNDENQSPEDVLRCPLCDAVFYHLDAYEVHLTFHSSEDLYSEHNEILNNLTEYSLEAVPPIMEKVENDTAADDDEQIASSIGIESFLQQALNESVDNDNSNSNPFPEKRKKHKKHKKSKKPAITLDEFLNMNKDVFGEGIDFQGIEEVPTRVVAKQLKKQPTKSQARSKLTQSAASELEKLKSQGIVIKKKSGAPLRIPKKLLNKPINSTHESKMGQTKPVSESKSDNSSDVLSKFLNQSNSQLKIVKKSTTDTLIPEETHFFDNSTNNQISNEENISTEIKESNEAAKKGLRLEKYAEDVQKITDSGSECENRTNYNRELSNENDGMPTSQSKELMKQIDEAISTNLKKIDRTEKNSPTKNSVQKVSDIVKSSLSPKTNFQNASINTNYFGSDMENRNDTQETTNKLEQDPKTHNRDSLNALKHLSHLVIKSVNKPPQAHISAENNSLSCELLSDSNTDENITEQPCKSSTLDTIKVSKDHQEDQKDPTHCFETLKNLGKHLTIKSLNQSKSNTNFTSPKNVSSNKDEEMFDDDNMDLGMKSIDKDENVKDNFKASTRNSVVTSKTVSPLKNPEVKSLSSHSPNTTVKAIQNNPEVKSLSSHSPNTTVKAIQNMEKKVNDQNLKQSSMQNKTKLETTNLLNKLSNVTAKSIVVPKNVRQETTTNIKTSPQISSSPKKDSNLSNVKQKESRGEIEIFNIDDSDDEAHNQDNYKMSPKLPSQIFQIEHENNTRQILKNLGKHMSIKSNNAQSQGLKAIESKLDKCNLKSEIDISNNTKVTEQRNTTLQNTLKILSKNITIKSNSLNKPQINPEQLPSKYNLSDEDYNSDLNTRSKQLSVSEVQDGLSESEALLDHDDIIPSPNEFNSEDEDFFNHQNELLDIENAIKVNKVKKTVPKPNQNSVQLNSLKNISKDVSIKSVNDENMGDEYIEHEDNYNIPNINNQLSIKPFKSIKTTEVDDCTKTPNRNVTEVTQKITNQKPASSNRVNSVNKEVTVKTFQTKTVIQEITTTVTKTIKTVNQSVKQEVRNMSQASTSSSTIRPQKIQSMRPTQQIKNYPGSTGPFVRPSAPNHGPVIRNASQQVRPMMRIPTRPCNQLVPLRPSMNIIRTNVPKMTEMRKPLPKCSSQQSAIGKPLRISPNAVVSTTKRLNSDETSGPFSCFKKQRESLIPVPELPHFENDQDNETSLQYSSAHVSKSNFVSSTTKGNTVVTSNQTKTEFNACSQLKKLSNVSGLKIMKTSQSKQTTQVEESTESSAKRSALEAIEKLQKQGLLLKKPRQIEEYYSDHNDSGDDNFDT